MQLLEGGVVGGEAEGLGEGGTAEESISEPPSSARCCPDDSAEELERFICHPLAVGSALLNLESRDSFVSGSGRKVKCSGCPTRA